MVETIKDSSAPPCFTFGYILEKSVPHV